MTRKPQWVIDAGDAMVRQMADAQKYGLEALLNFKVSNTRDSGLDRHSGHPAQPDPPTRKDRST